MVWGTVRLCSVAVNGAVAVCHVTCCWGVWGAARCAGVFGLFSCPSHTTCRCRVVTVSGADACAARPSCCSSHCRMHCPWRFFTALSFPCLRRFLRAGPPPHTRNVSLVTTTIPLPPAPYTRLCVVWCGVTWSTTTTTCAAASHAASRLTVARSCVSCS